MCEQREKICIEGKKMERKSDERDMSGVRKGRKRRRWQTEKKVGRQRGKEIRGKEEYKRGLR